ncbi:MAG: polyprenyl synthetase family protein [Planctomycetota bacterium]|nr:MAG: polyprenyl synthetase family protein [Planctomycetota bacterium]
MSCTRPIRRWLDESTRVFRDALDSDQPVVRGLCAHLERYHGKQLRPAFLLLSAAATGGVRRAHVRLAAVVELVHIATLVHDDVLDDADVRRAAPATHRLCGNERAVLLGDYLFSHAYRLCSTLDSQFAAEQIGRTAATLCEGEMMQVTHRGDFDVSEDLYLEIIRRKTASLIATCGLLGAHYAGADERTCARLETVGRSLGVAFQIVDDVLDIDGDEGVVGKSLHRDVEMGKLTLPVIHHLATVDDAQRRVMLDLLQSSTPDRDAGIRTALASSDSLDYALNTAQTFVQNALDALEGLPPSEARDSLQAMAEFVVVRRR